MILLDNKHFFIRKEKKYIIDENRAAQIRGEITSRLRGDKHTTTGNPFVQSVYFDNVYWKTYVDHKNREQQRFKLRVRTYSKNNKKCFIELKEKSNGITCKSRFKIDTVSLSDLLARQEVLNRLFVSNKKLSRMQLVQVYRKIIDTITMYDLVPVIKIRYQRESYEDLTKKIRITFDRNITFYALENKHTKALRKTFTYPQSEVIMEIKTSTPRPLWIKQLVKKYQLRKKRFSKYCTAVEGLYARKEWLHHLFVRRQGLTHARIS